MVADQDEHAAREIGQVEGYGRGESFDSRRRQSRGRVLLDTFEGPPRILINNLGVGDARPFTQITDEQWAQSFQTNLMGTVRRNMRSAFLPKMAERGCGCDREYGLRSGEAAGTGVYGLRRV